MGFGKKLEALIKYRGTNVNRVSKQTGIKTQTLYLMIKRDSKSTDMTTMGLLANALDVNVSYFYDDDYNVTEKGITIKKEIDLSPGTLRGTVTLKKEWMNLFFFMANQITSQNHLGMLYSTDAITLYVKSYLRKMFFNSPALWEQDYVTIQNFFVEYPQFYLADFKITYRESYTEAINEYLSKNQITENELIEFIVKSILKDYIELNLKGHVLYAAPSIKELTEWRPPFKQRIKD